MAVNRKDTYTVKKQKAGQKVALNDNDPDEYGLPDRYNKGRWDLGVGKNPMAPRGSKIKNPDAGTHPRMPRIVK